MTRASTALEQAFGERLFIVGLQGSMRRGEATPASDIDVLIVLDHLAVSDLRRCREVLDGLPEGHRAHGFTCGREELAAWPRSEVFAFAQDVRCYRGDLAPLLPEVEHRDVVEGARLAVSGLYHAVAHTLLSSREPGTEASVLRKMLFYAMLQTTCLRCGVFAATRAELLTLVTAEEAALLTGTDEALLDDALAWASRRLREIA